MTETTAWTMTEMTTRLLCRKLCETERVAELINRVSEPTKEVIVQAYRYREENLQRIKKGKVVCINRGFVCLFICVGGGAPEEFLKLREAADLK